MNNREQAIEVIAQTLAPGLFKLFGVRPEDMGFPIYDTKEEVETHLARQFDPVAYWTGEARKIAISVFEILDAGGPIPEFNIDKMLQEAARHRHDVSEAGEHLPA